MCFDPCGKMTSDFTTNRSYIMCKQIYRALEILNHLDCTFETGNIFDFCEVKRSLILISLQYRFILFRSFGLVINVVVDWKISVANICCLCVCLLLRE